MDAPVLGLLVLGLAAYPIVPALAWATPLLYVIWFLVSELRQIPKADRYFALGCCGLALVIQAGFDLLNFGYNPAVANTRWLDDHGYYKQATAVADVWRTGVFPILAAKGSALYYLGSLHTGYVRVLASAFLLTGPSTVAGLALNALGTALLPVLAMIIGNALFEFRKPGTAPTNTDRHSKSHPAISRFASIRALSSARLAALLTALLPTTYYWGSMLLKDALLTVLFVAALAVLLSAFRTPRASRILAFTLLTGWVAVFRNYVGLALVAGATVGALSSFSIGRVVRIGVYAAILLGILAVYTDTGSRYTEQMLYSLVSLLGPVFLSPQGVLVELVRGLPRMLLAPYAWVKAAGPAPLYELYPAMWMLYLVVYPAAFAGLWNCLRRYNRLSIVPVTTGAATCFILLLAYGGDAVRQRHYMEVLAAVFAGYGMLAPRAWKAFVAFYSILFLFAAAQLVNLYLRG